jgi:quercetin dioxygenase-like cupin family protein
MKVIKYDEVPWTDPDNGSKRASRGIQSKALSTDYVGFVVRTSSMPPGLRIDPHSHNIDELIVILEGSATLDSGDTVTADDCVLFPANEVYGFTVGDDGLRFVVIRRGEATLEFKS